jgi:UDP-N-acetyl-D-mannosaminuronate dehydrogenase
LKGKHVAVLGVSYRGDVGDTRFTPVNLFVTCLEDGGATVVCHDPFVAFWTERERDVAQDLGVVLAANPSIVVISAGHKQYTFDTTISMLMGCSPMTVFDTIGLFTENQIELLSKRHVVSVLGRGDI